MSILAMNQGEGARPWNMQGTGHCLGVPWGNGHTWHRDKPRSDQRGLLGCAAKQRSNVMLVQPFLYDRAHMSNAGPCCQGACIKTCLGVVRTATCVRHRMELTPVCGQGNGSIPGCAKWNPSLRASCLVGMYSSNLSCLSPGQDPAFM